jgi:hypothetical protein
MISAEGRWIGSDLGELGRAGYSGAAFGQQTWDCLLEPSAGTNGKGINEEEPMALGSFHQAMTNGKDYPGHPYEKLLNVSNLRPTLSSAVTWASYERLAMPRRFD